MPRPARFDHAAILDAALRTVAARGPAAVTVEAVAGQMGGHPGSIYYRFPTKERLLAEVWLRAARAGQAGLLAALSLDDLDQALGAAVLHYPRWSRADLPSAQLLAAHERTALIPRWPDELATALSTVNDDLITALDTFTRRWHDQQQPTPGGHDSEHSNSGQPDTGQPHRRRLMTFAVLDLPNGAIRRYLLAGKHPPDALDGPILTAARAALAPPASHHALSDVVPRHDVYPGQE